jgi:signal transduction histidine kinase
VLQDGGGVVLIAVVLGLLVTRWRRATPPGRRVLATVLPAGALAVTLLAAQLILQVTGEGDLRDVTDLVSLAAFAAVPLVFLAGMVRDQALRSGSVGGLVVELGTRHGDVDLGSALRRALRDDTLEVVYSTDDDGSYVDAHGRPVDLSVLPRGRTATKVARGGRTVAALVHDSALRDDPSLVDAVSAAAGLALENERLQAQLRARLDELRASRARIVEAGDAERRRLERNLHDGAQQRLVVLSLGVRMARSRLDTDPTGAGALLEDAGAQLDLALAELRELARGIHPAVLTDRGLGPAIESLVGRSALNVTVLSLPQTRLPPRTEVAAYFVVAEALTNVVKYASASRVTVDVSEHDGNVVVEISDDGVGGADPRAGSGLRGLADRVEALDGLLHVVSPTGEGTTVRAVIPCGS